jgi:hypothetical protein
MSKSEVNFNNGAGEHVLIGLGTHKAPFVLIGWNRNEAMGRLQFLKSRNIVTKRKGNSLSALQRTA